MNDRADGAPALSADDLGSFATGLGLRLAEATGEQVTADWQVTDRLLQPYGMLHGGVHCSVVETLASIGAALWWGARGRVVGVANATDFFRISRPGEHLTSTARPVHRGRSRQVWRVETVNAAGQLVAAGQVGLQHLPE